MVVMVTTTTELIETGEQRDSRGRKRMPAQRREALVAAWSASGLTQAQFARREGVKYPTFAHWVQQARRRGLSPATGGKVQFAEVRMPAIPPASVARAGVEVRLLDGVVVRGEDVQQLAAVVRALRR